MLSFRLRRQPRRIGGQKGEGRVLIVAVLGKIEVNTADQVPRRISVPKEVLDLASELGQLAAKGGIQFPPKGTKHRRRKILRSGHRGCVQHQRIQLRIGRRRNWSLRRRVRQMRLRAEARHIVRTELSPVGEDRGDRRACLSSPKL